MLIVLTPVHSLPFGLQVEYDSPSDVCADLLRHLMEDKACRQVLLQRCNGDAAALAAELVAKGLSAGLVQH